MKKLLILGVIMLFVFCAPKKTTVKTEGLEEVVVFGEEGKNISEEPVYPTPAPVPATPAPVPETPAPTPEVSAPPTEAPALPPAIEETPAPMEEVTIAPPVPTPVAPLPMEEVTALPPIPAPAPTYTPSPSPSPSTTPASIYGFRVQIFASSTQKGASKVADDARGLFGGKVYIEHTPPYYKVRIGDCLTKEEAESLKNLAISKGFRGAFVVETMINP
ncbi:MAG: SPOR domain-containing protein [candidate division WOR-3 bacterium]